MKGYIRYMRELFFFIVTATGITTTIPGYENLSLRQRSALPHHYIDVYHDVNGKTAAGLWKKDSTHLKLYADRVYTLTKPTP